MNKLISIVTPCFNEEGNVEELYNRIRSSINLLVNYNFEIIFIDNASEDGTVSKIKVLASLDPRVKLIVNTRNFGHIRSPYYGILSSKGEATIYLASDLQDPPEIIPTFIKHWEAGFKLVMATKPSSKEGMPIRILRKAYYRLLDEVSEISVIKNCTGFGLYDKEVLNKLREIRDPYPFLRGLICELGYKIKTIEFEQPRRARGLSKNNFYSLYDIAMLGLISHSKLPLRIVAFIGFILGLSSLFLALVFIILKLINWNAFPLGVAPAIILVFFMFGILLISIGILGEYIGSIHTYLQNRPVVVEKERINFD